MRTWNGLTWIVAGLFAVIMAITVVTTEAGQHPDCLIVAMEMDARISDLTAFHTILAFRVWDTCKDVAGISHAACVFKLTRQGPVYLYDEDAGSVTLPTTEWNAWKIEVAINRVFKAGGVQKIVYDVEVLK